MKEPVFQELLHQIEEIIRKIVVRIKGHTEVNDTFVKEENQPDEGRYPNRDRRPPRRGGSQDNGRLPDRHGGPLMEEGPLTMEGHLMGMEDHQDALIEEDPQDLEDLLDQ